MPEPYDTKAAEVAHGRQTAPEEIQHGSTARGEDA